VALRRHSRSPRRRQRPRFRRRQRRMRRTQQRRMRRLRPRRRRRAARARRRAVARSPRRPPPLPRSLLPLRRSLPQPSRLRKPPRRQPQSRERRGLCLRQLQQFLVIFSCEAADCCGGRGNRSRRPSRSWLIEAVWSSCLLKEIWRFAIQCDMCDYNTGKASQPTTLTATAMALGRGASRTWRSGDSSSTIVGPLTMSEPRVQGRLYHS